MFDTISYITALVLIVPGIFLALLPMVPAVPYMFVVSLVFGFVDGFDRLSGKEALILFAFALVSTVIDNIFGLLGAKLGGAHAKSLLWGIAGAILGVLILPPLGSLAGLFVGVLAGELYYKKTGERAFKAAGGALVGSALGIFANVILAISFAACFFFFALS